MLTPTFRSPVDAGYVVTQPFGCTGFQREPPLGTCAHFHRGLDLGNGRCGGNVYAAAAGTVRYSGVLADGAQYVSIDHGGGWFSQYIHLSARVVRAGQQVAAGELVGMVGDTGNATACHLHFGVKSGASATVSLLDDGNGTWVDPEGVIDKMFSAKSAGSILGTFVLGVGHQFISPDDWSKHYGPYPTPQIVSVLASLNLTDAAGTPKDIDGNQPPQNSRDQVYLVDAPTFGVAALALRADGTFTPAAAPPGASQADLAAATAAGFADAKQKAITAVEGI